MIISNSSYPKPRWFSGQHFETIIPSQFRKVNVQPTETERIKTPDNDFLDIDWYKVGSKQLSIVSHGLEGSSQSQYAVGVAKYFNSKEIDVLCWNYRGCSGEMNKLPRFYHSGATEDLHTIVKYAVSIGYTSIALIGFSLGGNLTLKFLGERSLKYNQIKTAVAFSAPVHLSNGCDEISRPKNILYANRFIRKLKHKIKTKNKLMGEKFPLNGINKINNLRQFDNTFTGPLHGFKDAEDYYTKCSSIFYLDGISIPTLLVNALNDPFLPKSCYPFEQLEKHEFIYFESPKHGGHVGFKPAASDGSYWSERRAYEFITRWL